MGYRSLSEGEINALHLKINALRDKRELGLICTVVTSSIPPFAYGDVVTIDYIDSLNFVMKINKKNMFDYSHLLPINSSSITNIRIKH